MTPFPRTVMIAALAGLALLRAPTAHAAPDRVVSINLCTDQLLLLLADPEQIASVSFLAADREASYVADRAADVPANHGLAEEILTLQPDLVLAGIFGATAAITLLRAHGVPVVQIGLADDFAAIAEQTRTIAVALGAPERGEMLVARMEDRLSAAAPPSNAARPTAAVYQADGFTAGAGTLADAVLAAAGFDNAAAKAGLIGYGYLPLETLLTAMPDVLIVDRQQDGPPSLAHALLRHPALDRLAETAAVAALPSGTLTCGGPYTAEAVAALAELRDRLVAETGP